MALSLSDSNMHVTQSKKDSPQPSRAACHSQKTIEPPKPANGAKQCTSAEITDNKYIAGLPKPKVIKTSAPPPAVDPQATRAMAKPTDPWFIIKPVVCLHLL
jgi:hypothetical protein